MVTGVRSHQIVRPIALVPALLVMIVGACSSTTGRASSGDGDAATSTSAFGGPPTGTLPPLVAPPRSYRPVFSGEAAAVEQAFRNRLGAFDRHDIDAVLASSAKPDTSLRDDVAAFMDTYRAPLYRINAIKVNGNNATIDYENSIVGRNLRSKVTTLLGQREVWTKSDGQWKSVSDESVTPGIPEDLRSVTVTLPDGGPIDVPASLPSTDFAFRLKNTGSATKGLFILGIPADADVAALIPAVAKVGDDRANHLPTPMPDGVLEMGATPDVAAHQDGTMVFNGRLPKGRYLLMARAASNGDQPGSLLPNEYAEFTVK
jgi:hypothetical protein